MASQKTQGDAGRTVSRWIAYPVLLAIPVGAFFGGIWLGENDTTGMAAVWPGLGGAVGNWVLFLIGAGLTCFLLAVKFYGQGVFAPRSLDVLFVGGALASLLLAGTMGLAITMVAASVLYYMGMLR